MKSKLYKYLPIIIIIFTMFIITTKRESRLPVEELDLPSTIATDVVDGRSRSSAILINGNEPRLESYFDMYNFLGASQEASSYIRAGVGQSIGDTRSSRALMTNHKVIFGSEKLYIMGEELGRKSMRVPIDSLFRNPEVNDMGYVVICRGKAYDMLKLKVQGYPSIGDYIQSMIENLPTQNFFGDEYKLIDLFVRIDTEGRNASLPYIENRGGVPQVAGIALFKNDKVVQIIDIGEARIMNLLRSNDVWGIIGLKGEGVDATEIYANSKRKVTCKKENGKCTFTVDLDMKGELITDEVYKKVAYDKDVKKKYEEDLAKDIEKKCYEFLDKMKNKYNIDALEYGRVAAAKFGRNTGVDWNEVVCNSDIKVNVKVTVTGFGRGNF